MHILSILIQKCIYYHICLKAHSFDNICSFIDILQFMSNLNTFDLESSEIIHHSFNIYFQKIQLNTNFVQNIIWLNKSLRNLIRFLNYPTKNINQQTQMLIMVFFRYVSKM